MRLLQSYSPVTVTDTEEKVQKKSKSEKLRRCAEYVTLAQG